MKVAAAFLFTLLLAASPAKKNAGRSHHTAIPQPQSVGDYFNAIDYAMDAEEYYVAEKIAREGQGRFPQAVGFHLLIGDALAARDKKADAFYEYQWEVMRTGADRPSGAEAQLKAAKLMLGRGTDVDELRVTVQAIKDMSTKPEDAADTLERLASRRPAFILDVLAAEADAKAGRTRDAVDTYRSLIKRDPYFVPAYVELAELYRKAGKAKDATTLLQQAQEIDADHWRLKGVEVPAP